MMRIHYFSNFILLIGFIIAILSCSYRDVYEKYLTLEKGNWPSTKILNYDYQSIDTLQVYNIFINIRHTGSYQYDNIYLFVTTQAPNGNTHKDTVEFILADEHGKWTGNGIGDMFDVRLAFKRNIRFGQIGDYSFQIKQAMRDNVLKYITDVGIRVEKAK